MLNKTLLQGRLTRDPEYFPEKKYARYTLAVDNYNADASFIDCVTFNGGAEFADKYLKKGTLILVEGSIKTGKYQSKEGTNVKTTTVVVREHHFCEAKKTGAGFEGINAEIDEELPFE